MKVLTPPHSKDSEMMVLGCMLTNAGAMSVASNSLQESHFYFSQHRTIFRVLKTFQSANKAADVHLVSEELKDQQKLEEIGGTAYLVSLAQFAGTSAYIEEYVEILKTKMKLRKLLEMAKGLETSAMKNDIDPDMLVQRYRESLNQIVDIDEDVFLPSLYTYKNLLADLSKTREGLKTGYPSLDEVIEIPQGAITLVAGRPSHGKTITQLNLLIKMIKRYPHLHFYFFSYEETKSQILLKILNILAEDAISESHNLANIEGYIRGGHNGRPKIEAAAADLQALTESGRLVICDHSYYVDDLSLVLSKLKKKLGENLGAIFIDYIQKIKIKYKYPTRQLELQKISAEILEAAKSHNLPIILGAQLGRGTGKKEVLRLDNLREAGDIENDSKLVLGIWNQAKEEPDNKDSTSKGRIVDLEFVVLKNRNGPSNQSIFLDFDKPLSLLKEKQKEYQYAKQDRK